MTKTERGPDGLTAIGEFGGEGDEFAFGSGATTGLLVGADAGAAGTGAWDGVGDRAAPSASFEAGTPSGNDAPGAIDLAAPGLNAAGPAPGRDGSVGTIEAVRIEGHDLAADEGADEAAHACECEGECACGTDHDGHDHDGHDHGGHGGHGDHDHSSLHLAVNGGGTIATNNAGTTWSYQQIADYLRAGYWDEAYGFVEHHLLREADGAITYSFDSSMPASYVAKAEAAMQLWSDITGIEFREVASGGTINYVAPATGLSAFAQKSSFSVNGDGTYTALGVTVSVTQDWLTSQGADYTYQTFIHEIGHALGLGHGDNYNGDLSGYTAQYANDSWQASVMSYLAQDDNANVSAARAYLLTPMVADVIAMQDMYGASTTTRTGDTVYGFNASGDSGVFDASFFTDSVTFGGRFHYYAGTIVDSGGTDTLDVSGLGTANTVSLLENTYSSFGARTGVLGIGQGSVIENFEGGSGADTVLGNAADNVLSGNGGNDVLNGGAGNDTLLGGAGTDTLNGGDDNDVLDGGAGIDALDGGAGDDRVVYDASDSSVTGGAGTDTLVVADGYASGFDLLANGFEFLAAVFTDVASEIWETLTELYDASRTLVDYDLVYDDGTTGDGTVAGGELVAVLRADVGDIYDWATIEETFVGGVVRSETTTYDDGDAVGYRFNADGSTASITWTDGSDAEAWASRTTTYDADGNALVTRTTGDDGAVVATSAASMAGTEDAGAVAVPLVDALATPDGSTVQAVTLSGFPAGTTFSLGALSGTDWVISSGEVASLASLTMTPPAQWSGDVALRAVVTEFDGGGTVDVSLDIPVAVASVLDGATVDLSLVGDGVIGAENASITLPVAFDLVDEDGSEEVVIVVSGVPEGGSIAGGIEGDPGVWTVVSTVSIASLTMTPPADWSGTVTLGVQTHARETGSAATTAVQSFDVPVTIEAVEQAPGATGPLSGQGATEGQDATIDATAMFSDPDGRITHYSALNLPDGLSIDAATGAIRGQPGDATQTGDVTVTVRAHYMDGATESFVEQAFTLALTGINDDAVITGDVTGLTDEDGLTPATGTLSVSDVDSPETFRAETDAASDNGYGTFSIDASGNWSFAANATNPAVDALNDGDTLLETFTVASADGTQRTVTVTITGAVNVIEGTADADLIASGDGEDIVYARGGDDSVAAGGGDDILFGGDGDDILNGGEGTDTASFAGSATGVSVDLTEGKATGEGSDTLAGIENATGSAHADALVGDGGANVLRGGAGGDSLSGREGADEIYGEGGNDRIVFDASDAVVDGGTGEDTLVFGGDADAFALTGFDLAANGFEWLDTIETAPSAEVARRVTTLDVAGAVHAIVTTGTDGSVTRLVHDVADAAGWSSSSVTRDALGRTVEMRTDYDDGGFETVSTEYDDAQAQSWDSRSTMEGAEGTRWERTNYDDGSWQMITFDSQDTRGAVASSRTLFDADDVTLEIETVYENGDSINLDFTNGVLTSRTFVDGAGDNPYATLTERLDAGTLVGKRTVFDTGDEVDLTFLDGRLAARSYVDGSGDNAYARVDETFENGALVGKRTVLDTGDEIDLTFAGGEMVARSYVDGSGDNAYATFDEFFENGSLVRSFTVLDGGDTIEHGFVDGVMRSNTFTDVADSYDWVSRTITYDAAGNEIGVDYVF